jgi:aryl-alcohol dehydrogenase-like predicted oxidoreductase
MILPLLGIGTYLGDVNDNTDKKIIDVLNVALKNKINFIDTAPNYRFGRSEKLIGNFLSKVDRNKIILSTKVGFLPVNNSSIKDYKLYFEQYFIKQGIINISDIYGDWQSFSPRYIKWQIEDSLKNLNTNYIDIYFLHNPEEIRPYVTKYKFYDIIFNAFKQINKEILNGKIKYVGISSWNGFIRNKDKSISIDLEKIIEISKNTLVKNSFKYIQIPYNLGMTEHLTQKSQIINKQKCSLISASKKYSLKIISNAPFHNGKLFSIDFPHQISNICNSNNKSEAALKFALSNPGVDLVLMGTTNINHLYKAIHTTSKERISPSSYKKLFTINYNV